MTKPAAKKMNRCACTFCSNHGFDDKTAVKKNGKVYCSSECADGHPNGEVSPTCCHQEKGCTCMGHIDDNME